MDFSAVGKKIKELRKNSKLSQEELAEGICTQAQISKIEKGIVYPFAPTLYQISQKLGVDVNYFFDIGMTPRLDYVQEVFRQLKITRRNHQYEDMMSIVKVEKNNPLFEQNNRNKQLLFWHKGIYQFEVDDHPEKAINTLQNAISLTKTSDRLWSEREIEINLTIGAILVKQDLNKAVILFKEIESHLEALPSLSDVTIKTRLYYNISRVVTRLNKTEESNKYCDQGITWCLERDSLYLLGQLHYQKGYNFELDAKFQEAIRYMEKALVIFELQQDDKYTGLIQNKIKEFSRK
jgi:transcriptional regulator with XRE-family HTH domain